MYMCVYIYIYIYMHVCAYMICVYMVCVSKKPSPGTAPAKVGKAKLMEAGAILSYIIRLFYYYNIILLY